VAPNPIILRYHFGNFVHYRVNMQCTYSPPSARICSGAMSPCVEMDRRMPTTRVEAARRIQSLQTASTTLRMKMAKTTPPAVTADDVCELSVSYPAKHNVHGLYVLFR